MAFYSGNYGGPLGRIDTSPITRGAQAQAQMYQNLGNAIASVANTYFKKKEEDKQIDALADNEAVLNHVYGGRVDAAGLPVMPSDPKEVRKDIRALYRRIGPAGIEAATRADQADARAQQVLEMQQKAADAAERRSNQQDAEHEFKLRQRDLKMDVFKAAYKGQTIKEKKEVPPSTIGQYFKKAVGGADLSKLAEASGRLGHPLSEGPAWTAMRDPSNYLKGLAMPPDDTPQPAPPQTYTSPKPSYLGDMLSKAGEAIGGVEIPGTGRTTLSTREVAPAIESAYSIGDLVDNVMDVPGMTEEHIPYIVELGKSEGLTSMGRSTYGLSKKLLKNPDGTPIAYFTEGEIRRAADDLFVTTRGVRPTDAQMKSIISSAHMVDLEKLTRSVMKEVQEEGLDKQYERLDKLKEARVFLDEAKSNPNAIAPLQTNLARLFEPQGILTDADISRYAAGDQSFLAEINRVIAMKLTGEIEEVDLDNIEKILDRMKGVAASELGESVPRLSSDIAERYSISEEAVYGKTPLGRYRDATLEAAGGVGSDVPPDLETKLRNAKPGDMIDDPSTRGKLKVFFVDPQGRVHYTDANGNRLVLEAP